MAKTPAAELVRLGDITPETLTFSTAPEFSKPTTLVDKFDFEQDESMRGTIKSVMDLAGRRYLTGPAVDDQLSTHTCLTHPDMNMEIYLDTETPHGNYGEASLMGSVMGRIWDTTLNFKSPQAVAAVQSSTDVSVVDRDMMQGIHGMREEVNRARADRSFSPYERLVDGNGDVIFIFEVLAPGKDGLKPEERDRYHRNGSLVLRSIVDTSEIHAEDTLVALTAPVMGDGPHGHTYEIGWGFADAEATKLNFSAGGELSDLFEGAVNKPDMKVARNVLDGTAARILNPTIDFKTDELKDVNGNKRKIKPEIATKVERVYKYLQGHQGSAAEPARSILRAHFRLQQLDNMMMAKVDGKPNPNFRPNGNEAIKKERQRVWYGLAHMFQYLEALEDWETKQEKFANGTKDTDMNLRGFNSHPATMADPRRLEFVAFDELDDVIDAAATNSIQKLDEAGVNTGVGMLRELQEHILHGRRNPRAGDNLWVKAFHPPNPRIPGSTGNELELIFDTRPSTTSAGTLASFGFKTHLGLPYGSQGGHYRDEIVTSLVDTRDPKKDSNFPHGLATSGVVAIVRPKIPEIEPTSNRHDRPLLVAMSARYSPDILRRNILDPIYKSGTLKEQQANYLKLLTQRTDYADIMMQSGVPSWSIFSEVNAQPAGQANPDGTTRGLPRRMEMPSKPFRNGDAVTAIEKIDKKAGVAKAYFVRGHIPDEKPQVRTFGSKRVKSKTPIRDVVWDEPELIRPIVQVTIDGKPAHVRTENRLIDVRFARNAVYATRFADEPTAPGEKPTVQDSAAAHSRKISTVRRNWTGKKVRRNV